MVTYESWHFLCLAHEYLVAGAAVLPAIGDRFTTEDGAIYEVQPLPNGKHYRYNDSRRVMLRIHAKLVSEA